MGSGPSALSKTSTVEDVANSLGSLGPAYEIYRRVVTDNGINGIAIMSLRTKEEIEVMFSEFVPKLHMLVISSNILELTNSNRKVKQKKTAVSCENDIGNMIFRFCLIDLINYYYCGRHEAVDTKAIIRMSQVEEV